MQRQPLGRLLVMDFAMREPRINPMANQRVQWLAARELIDDAEPANRCQAQIGLPERLREDEWRCRFRIQGLDKGKMYDAHGVDAIQALVNALEGLARLVRSKGTGWTWRGGEAGDSGFRMQVPIYLGPSFASQIESMIEKKVQNKVKQLAKKAQSKSKEKAF